MQRDPLGLKIGSHLSEYVSSRPSIFSDPMGLAQCEIRPGDPICGNSDWPPLVDIPPAVPKLPRTEHPEGVRRGWPSAGSEGNCLGTACGRRSVINWPHTGVRDCSDGTWRQAQASTIEGCKKIPCSGISTNKTRCKCCDPNRTREIYVILARYKTDVIFRDGSRSSTIFCSFHAVGRNPCKERAWESKQDVGQEIVDIRSPKRNWEVYYDAVANHPDTEIVEMCFCCRF
jgi:hypothetical protein